MIVFTMLGFAIHVMVEVNIGTTGGTDHVRKNIWIVRKNDSLF
ncbi:protein of unknown function [Candidatus Nitrosocosmicus franklandus]|uniref:Uncharacterized protein n=1 Tax=Candidatus Nitrosocosmicus franklandianus TaxID=1798806 RepID=A0A484I590_9ARCH|nr:protein of unknown function [Candidatus Nitrosocosmicus franklandus]